MKLNFKLTNSVKERHGMRHTRFYSIWCGMKNRCNCPTSKDFNNYGGRGVSVCKEWEKFSGFKNDLLDSYVHHLEKFGITNTTLDRIDPTDNYTKDNCRWATRKEQAINKTSFGVEKRTRNILGQFTNKEEVESALRNVQMSKRPVELSLENKERKQMVLKEMHSLSGIFRNQSPQMNKIHKLCDTIVHDLESENKGGER